MILHTDCMAKHFNICHWQ